MNPTERLPTEETKDNPSASLLNKQIDTSLPNSQEDENNLPNRLKGRAIEIDESKRLTHQSIWIEGIEVFFPFKPYSVQQEYMRSVIQSLNNNSNALLQSPTGTGKTLSLLCAALAWLRNQRMTCKTSSTRILFCSRTHAQLKQVVKELKSTAYKAKVCIMASRDQYCLKKEFSNLKDLELNGACKKSIQEKSCQYYNYKGTDKRQLPEILDDVLDIEDLQLKGSAASSSSCGKFCPYYYSREIKDEADVVVLPYSFLLQQNRFAEFQVILNDSIIIFDEAHNVPAQAEEGTSYKVDQNLINESRKELDYLLAHLAPPMRTRPNDIADVQQLVTAFGNLLRYFEKSASLERQRDGSIGKLSPVSYFFEMIEQIAGQLVTNKPEKQKGKGLPEKNQWYSKVNGSNKFDYKAMLSDLKAQKEQKESTALPGGQKTLFNFQFKKTANSTDKTSKPKEKEFTFQEKIVDEQIPQAKEDPSIISLAKMGELGKKMSIIIADMQTMKCQNIDFFAGFVSGVCHMYDQEVAFNKGIIQSKVSDLYRFYFHKGTNINEQSSMNLWCLDPSLAFSNILKQQPHSIILTSGTLNPMESWDAELKMPFAVKLTASHVINPKKSVIGSIVKSGPSGSLLNFSYNNRQSGSGANQTYDELGEFLIDLSKKVPNGILVCFSSGSLMKLTQESWIQSPNTIISRLSELKEMFFEPKNNIELTSIMKQYCTKANDDQQGAILFCVCRGKISEGIDFTDKLARAVVVVGVPFPPSADTWVLTKQEYLDTTLSKNSKNTSGQKFISGKEWYFLCTVRAMNQALGRVIRHKDDFGGVFLCDSRFSQSQFDDHISSWVKEALAKYVSYSSFLYSIEQFFSDKKPKLTSLEQMLQIGGQEQENPKLKQQKGYVEKVEVQQSSKRLPSEISYSTKVTSDKSNLNSETFAEIFSEKSKMFEESSSLIQIQEEKEEIPEVPKNSWNNLLRNLPSSPTNSVESSRHSTAVVSNPMMTIIPKRKFNININKKSEEVNRNFSCFESGNNSFTFESSQTDFDRPHLKLKQSLSRQGTEGDIVNPKLSDPSQMRISVLTTASTAANNYIQNSSHISENSKSTNFLSDVFREHAMKNSVSSLDEDITEFDQRRSKSLKVQTEFTTDSQHKAEFTNARNSAPVQQTKIFDKAMLSNTRMGLASFKEGDVKQIKFKDDNIKESSPSEVINTSIEKEPSGNDKIMPEDGSACPICYEAPKDNHKNSTCGHKACLACWKNWLSEQLTCPLCRVRCRLPYLEPCP